MNLIKKYFSEILIALFLVLTALLFIFVGDGAYIAVHDNLDLFQPQFMMMKETGTFFSHGVESPFLGGISRDVMPSEFSFTTLLYVVFPSLFAYVLNYISKILIAIVSGRLLAGELLAEDKEKYRSLVNLCAFAYGILNLFPCFGVPFASIPLVVYLLLKIERSGYDEKSDKKILCLWYAGLFCYPFLSYFSYIGIFILAYMAVALIWLSIARRKFDLRMFIAIIVLAIGCALFEYRLFATMLFSDEVTIRSTMVLPALTLKEALAEACEVFVDGQFHADAVTSNFVMPICVLYFVIVNLRYITKKQIKNIFKEPFNLVMLIIAFDCFIYGLYDYEPFRNLIETLVPPLRGWQFNRTQFFNPFMWSVALFMICKCLYDISEEKTGTVAENRILSRVIRVSSYGIVVLYIAIILITPTRYNDLRTTAVNTLKKAYGNTIDDFSYGEFYNVAVFEEAKRGIDYNNEWSVAYGLYPAMLEYNGIYTLDGYLGYYSQEYKEEFRKVIAPALDRVEPSRIYYDDWGARAYLYSGDEPSIMSTLKSYVPESTDLYIDVDALKELGGKYIFSRFELTGETVGKLRFKGTYGDGTSSYMIYVYEVCD